MVVDCCKWLWTVVNGFGLLYMVVDCCKWLLTVVNALPVLQPYISGLDWQKWGLQAITADAASLHTSRCQLMDSFSFR